MDENGRVTRWHRNDERVERSVIESSPLHDTHDFGHCVLGNGGRPGGRWLLARHLGPERRLRLPGGSGAQQPDLDSDRFRRVVRVQRLAERSERASTPGQASAVVLRRLPTLHRGFRLLLRKCMARRLAGPRPVHRTHAQHRFRHHRRQLPGTGDHACRQEHLRAAVLPMLGHVSRIL